MVKIKIMNPVKRFNSFCKKKSINFFNTESAILYIVIFIYSVTFSLAFLKYIPILGNYNDIFQINNGYVFGKMKLHHDFHSPFGLFYHVFHFIALQIISFFKMNTAGIIFLSNLLFGLFIHLLFILINKDKSIKKLSNTILLLLTLIVFNAVFSFDRGWLGLNLKFIPPVFYNAHLYTLILLFSGYILSYKENLDKNITMQNNYIKYKSFISAVFLFISLNYKVNFFPSMCALCFAFFLIIPKKKQFFFFTSLFFSILVAVSFACQYDYIAYFKDLVLAVGAGEDNIFRDYFITKIFILLSVILTLLSIVIYFLKKNEPSSRSLMVYLLILVSIFLPVGNTGYLEIVKIFSFFLLILSFLIKDKKVAYFFIFLFFAITIYKYQKSFKGDYRNFYFKGKNNNFMGIKIDQKEDMYGEKIVQDFTQEILSQNLDKETLFTLSYNILPKFREKIFKTKNFNAHNILPFAMQDTKKVLSENNIKYNTSIFDTKLGSQVAFFGYRIPKDSLHWPHIGVSIAKKDLKKALDINILKNSDIVLLSLFDNANTSNNHDDNTLINCFFYEFNDKYNKFKLWKITKFAIYFVDENYAKENNIKLEKDFKINKNDIKKICTKYISIAMFKKFFTLEDVSKLD